MVKEELGAEIEEIFDEWDWTPLGAASLGKYIYTLTGFFSVSPFLLFYLLQNFDR